MSLPENDTIAAIATPPGRGGIGIVRVSGSQVKSICQTLFGRCPVPRVASLHTITDAKNVALDEGLVLFFEGPNSFTGEDVLEWQGHGGPFVLDAILSRFLSLGVRPARPGEFSERAFLNNKLDLAQAEAIADLIDAQSQEAARSAMRSLQGAFSEKIQYLLDKLIAFRVYIEACIDFPEEEIDFLKDNHIIQSHQTILQLLEETITQTQQGVVLKEGITLAIMGAPNVGKSSLLNYFTKQDSAIVSPIAGTTRDVIREHISIGGIPIHLMDTAGIRDSDDFIEKEGIKRAKMFCQQADLLLCMTTLSDYNASETLPFQHDSTFDKLPKIYVVNKIDLAGGSPCVQKKSEYTVIFVSITENLGLNLIEKVLIEMFLPKHALTEGCFMARRRHLEALHQTLTLLKESFISFKEKRAGELLAEDLRLAQQSLSSITGEFHSDDLLGEIFSHFCIGK